MGPQRARRKTHIVSVLIRVRCFNDLSSDRIAHQSKSLRLRLRCEFAAMESQSFALRNPGPRVLVRRREANRRALLRVIQHPDLLRGFWFLNVNRPGMVIIWHSGGRQTARDFALRQS
jgi:hypothetical protein